MRVELCVINSHGNSRIYLQNLGVSRADVHPYTLLFDAAFNYECPWRFRLACESYQLDAAAIKKNLFNFRVAPHANGRKKTTFLSSQVSPLFRQLGNARYHYLYCLSITSSFAQKKYIHATLALITYGLKKKKSQHIQVQRSGSAVFQAAIPQSRCLPLRLAASILI